MRREEFLSEQHNGTTYGRIRIIAGMPRRPGGLRAVRHHNVCASLCTKIACAPTSAGVPQEGGCQCESARAKAQGRHSEIRQLERLVTGVPSEFRICQASADDLRDCDIESFRIGLNFAVSVLAVVIVERLFINVSVTVKWLDAHIGTFDRSLQETPKVLHPIRVNASINVGFSMIDDLMLEFGKIIIGLQFVSEQIRARLYVPANHLRVQTYGES
jgi:hypothetical protein